MKLLPWTRSEEEHEQAALEVRQVRSHIRILVNELEKITRRIEAKAGRFDDG